MIFDIKSKAMGIKHMDELEKKTQTKIDENVTGFFFICKFLNISIMTYMRDKIFRQTKRKALVSKHITGFLLRFFFVF